MKLRNITGGRIIKDVRVLFYQQVSEYVSEEGAHIKHSTTNYELFTKVC
jgi:hypothetical protein